MSKVLTHSTKSYIKIFFVGILVGCICRLADYFPADTLWSFSSIQTLLGFWIITNTTIVLLSTSNICAGISSFLYMFGMTLSFYGLQAILGMFVPLFSGGFRFSLFVLFTLLSIPCAIAAYILYYWNREYIFNSILYSLPIGALAAEATAIFIHFLFFCYWSCEVHPLRNASCNSILPRKNKVNIIPQINSRCRKIHSHNGCFHFLLRRKLTGLFLIAGDFDKTFLNVFCSSGDSL